MALRAETTEKLRRLTETSCENETSDLPGVAVVIIDNNGNELFTHAAGKRGLASPEPMTVDNIFWQASCTKAITGIACLQLVERDILRLDDGEHLENLLPELKSIKVLRPDGTLEEKNKAITLRMLLTHTAGFAYTFFNERLRNWSLPAGIDEFSGRFEDISKSPLLFQPGEEYEYGTSIDWAGVALERATGLSLNEYLQQNLFRPLGLHDSSMLPDERLRSRLVYMHARSDDGILRPRDHIHRLPLVVDPNNKEETSKVFNSGGAGLFASPRDYCKILAVLLNHGTCPRTGIQLLRREMVNEMFTNQIPRFPNFGRDPIPAVKPELSRAIDEFYEVAGDPPQGWGLTFMLSNGGATGRSKGTAHWAGIANNWWWCDREKGVAGMVATQILPFGDDKVHELWEEVEAEIYRGLEQGTSAE